MTNNKNHVKDTEIYEYIIHSVTRLDIFCCDIADTLHYELKQYNSLRGVCRIYENHENDTQIN